MDFNESDEQIIAPLIESTESIDGAIKAIFEDGREDECQVHLEKFIKKKEQAIDDKCTYNHQAFYASVDELMQVQTDFRELKEDIQFLNSKLQSTGNKMLTQADELVRKRLIRKNIESALQILGTCRQCMATAKKAYEQIADNSLYPALKTIRELEKQLTAISEYKVGIVLQQRIPVMVDAIVKKVFNGFCEWSEPEANLDIAHAIGEKHMDLARARMENPNDEMDDDQDDLPLVEMTKVSLCCHVMESLKCHERFRACYIETRKAMFRNHLKLDNPRSRFKKRHQILWELYFTTIVGVFVVEDQIMHAYAEQFTSKVDTQEMWEEVQKNLMSELEIEIQMMSADAHVDLAKSTQELSVAMLSLGFDCGTISALVKSTSGEFKQKLKSQLDGAVERYSRNDNLAPHKVQSESEFSLSVAVVGLPAHQGKPALPHTFAFSKAFYDLCNECTDFFRKFGQFSQDDDDEFDEAEVMTCQKLFGESFMGALQVHFNPQSTSVNTAVRNLVDLWYLVTKFAPKCESVLLVQECGAKEDRAPTFVPILKPILDQVSEHLASVVCGEVHKIVADGASQIVWDQEEEDAKAKLNPSAFVESLLKFFTSEVFVHLQMLEPEKCKLNASEIENERKKLETTILTETNSSIVGLIDSPPKVTKFAMEAVQRDVTAIINELKNGNMSKLRSIKINNCFADVKEICDLLLKPGEIAKIADENYRTSTYKSDTKRLTSMLKKWEAGLPTKVFGNTPEQDEVAAALEALK